MKLKSYLLNNLTGQQLIDLPQLLGVTPTRRTQIFNNPESMRLEEIKRLALLLEGKITAKELIMQYRLGFDQITIAEMESISEI